MSEISKEDLKKEIQAILKDADLDNTSAKKVRLELQEKLDCDLTERKKEVDALVMEVIDEQTQEDDDGEEEEEEDEEEEEKSSKKPAAKRSATAKAASGSEEEEDEESEDETPKKKTPAKKRAKSESDYEDPASDSESEAEVPSDGGGSDYEPDEPVKIPKGRKKAAVKSKRKYGSDDESSGEEWGGSKKKKSKPKKKRGSSDDDSDTEKPKKKRKSGGGGYLAPVKLSAELADIVGVDIMPRPHVVKAMWNYIKENNLQDPKNKSMIKCDEKLSKIIPTKKFRGFGMTKFLKDHMNVE